MRRRHRRTRLRAEHAPEHVLYLLGWKCWRYWSRSGSGQTAPAADLTGVLMPAWNLTPREREVAALIIEGRSSDDIAASLFLSPHTVRDHTKAIFGKVGVHNRRHLTAALTGQPGEAA